MGEQSRHLHCQGGPVRTASGHSEPAAAGTQPCCRRCCIWQLHTHSLLLCTELVRSTQSHNCFEPGSPISRPTMPAVLQEVLDLAFAPVSPVSRAGRRSADLVRLVAGNPQGGASLAWQYLREHWGRLVQAQGVGR